MGQNFSTDLAREARDLWQKSAGEVPEGVTARREDRQGFVFEAVEIRTADAAEKLGMPVGRYVTMELDALFRREEDAFARAAEALAGELRRQLGLRAGESVTVVCLGNRDVTPDAVGPLTADSLLVTRHLRQTMPEVFGGFRPVSVLRTGVLGTTGVESAQLTAAVVGSIAPDRIVAVDALAARETGRLCRTVQITDAGIVPGSGVGNARQALTRDTLGIPVVSVGGAHGGGRPDALRRSHRHGAGGAVPGGALRHAPGHRQPGPGREPPHCLRGEPGSPRRALRGGYRHVSLLRGSFHVKHRAGAGQKCFT